jgi:hypothetical protein
LPPTLTFDNPTPTAVADYIVRQIAEALDTGAGDKAVAY